MELKGKTILVVDDEKDLCEILSIELQDYGAEILIAHDVNEALKLINNHDISLVITDIRMPTRSGLELLDTIRKTRVDLPVILITGFADISLAEAFDRGAEAMIQKPFDLDSLNGLCARLVKPLTERWMKEIKAKNLQLVDEKNLSYGRGGFFISQTVQPAVGSLFKLVIDRGNLPQKTFEVVCRWSRPLKKDGPTGWGAEIEAWDDSTAQEGWPHVKAVPFIPYS